MSGYIRELAQDLWVIDFPFKLMGADLGGRTTIVRLRNGGLWLHSPGPLGDGLQAEIEALGKVVSLVAPNLYHHMFLPENIAAFPDARVYGPPGIREKLPKLKMDEILDYSAPAAWESVISQRLVCGMPKLNEIVFLHQATRTLIITDISFNVHHSDSWFTRLMMRLNNGYGRFGPTRVLRSLIKEPAALKEDLQHILKWDFDRIIVTHGDVVERNGRALLKEAFALS